MEPIRDPCERVERSGRSPFLSGGGHTGADVFGLGGGYPAQDESSLRSNDGNNNALNLRDLNALFSSPTAPGYGGPPPSTGSQSDANQPPLMNLLTAIAMAASSNGGQQFGGNVDRAPPQRPQSSSNGTVNQNSCSASDPNAAAFSQGPNIQELLRQLQGGQASDPSRPQSQSNEASSQPSSWPSTNAPKGRPFSASTDSHGTSSLQFPSQGSQVDGGWQSHNASNGGGGSGGAADTQRGGGGGGDVSPQQVQQLMQLLTSWQQQSQQQQQQQQQQHSSQPSGYGRGPVGGSNQFIPHHPQGQSNSRPQQQQQGFHNQYSQGGNFIQQQQQQQRQQQQQQQHQPARGFYPAHAPAHQHHKQRDDLLRELCQQLVGSDKVDAASLSGGSAGARAGMCYDAASATDSYSLNSLAGSGFTDLMGPGPNLTSCGDASTRGMGSSAWSHMASNTQIHSQAGWGGASSGGRFGGSGAPYGRGGGGMSGAGRFGAGAWDNQVGGRGNKRRERRRGMNDMNPCEGMRGMADRCEPLAAARSALRLCADSNWPTEGPIYTSCLQTVRGRIAELGRDTFVGRLLQDAVSAWSALGRPGEAENGTVLVESDALEPVPLHIGGYAVRECILDFAQLMVDPVGNYLAQRVLEAASPAEVAVVAQKARSCFIEAALSQAGSRLVQRLVTRCAFSAPHELVPVLRLVEPHVERFLIDGCAAHTVAALSDAGALMGGAAAQYDMKFATAAVLRAPLHYAVHVNGCCAVKALLISAAGEVKRREELVDALAPLVCRLSVHPYGNYVVQCLLERMPRLNGQQDDDATPVETPWDVPLEDLLAAREAGTSPFGGGTSGGPSSPSAPTLAELSCSGSGAFSLTSPNSENAGMGSDVEASLPCEDEYFLQELDAIINSTLDVQELQRASAECESTAGSGTREGGEHGTTAPAAARSAIHETRIFDVNAERSNDQPTRDSAGDAAGRTLSKRSLTRIEELPLESERAHLVRVLRITPLLVASLQQLASNKFGSHVLEALLTHAPAQARAGVVAALVRLADRTILSLILNSYANFVLHRLVATSSASEFRVVRARLAAGVAAARTVRNVGRSVSGADNGFASGDCASHLSRSARVILRRMAVKISQRERELRKGVACGKEV